MNFGCSGSGDLLYFNALDFLQLSEVFGGLDLDFRIGELKAWLAAQGIQDLEAVPLDCDSVGKARTRMIFVRK